jgi:5-methylcytosine-specific restriction protein A
MFEIGRSYSRRRDIHARYGGQGQGGISTPRDKPYIFLFTGESGEQYGYRDGWDAEGVFLYTGEGQRGDMEFVRGNRAIRDHAGEGKELLLFEAAERGRYRYLGRFACTTWEYRSGPDKDGKSRRTIVFHLIREDQESEAATTVETSTESLPDLRERAYAAASPASQSREREAKTTYYTRSRDVRLYVLARAKGTCESCGKAAPFKRPDGSGYLEPHHTRRVSDGGPDHPRWVGAVCANCHREMHYGINAAEKNRQLEDHLGAIEPE